MIGNPFRDYDGWLDPTLHEDRPEPDEGPDPDLARDLKLDLEFDAKHNSYDVWSAEDEARYNARYEERVRNGRAV